MFNVGDFAFTEKDGQFHFVQVVAASTDYLIKDFWESSSSVVEKQEIRAWVKRVSTDALNNYSFLKNQVLNQTDELEIIRFLDIEKGLNNRKNRTASMQGLVKDAIEQTDYELALELLTEWAMLEKYRPEIYLLREDCLRKLDRNLEADYERHVYLTLTGK